MRYVLGTFTDALQAAEERTVSDIKWTAAFCAVLYLCKYPGIGTGSGKIANNDFLPAPFLVDFTRKLV
jgi:hypothetical protein